MAITLLKNVGFWVYDALLGGRAELRLKELTTFDYGSMPIRRSSATPNVAYLMSASAYESAAATLAAAMSPLPAQKLEAHSDDYLGNNVSKLMDLIQGKAQTAAQISEVIADGQTNLLYASFSFYDTKKYYRDEQGQTENINTAIPQKGDVVGYLVHPDVYAALSASPAAGTYTGTGNGTMTNIVKVPGAAAQTVTVTCTAAVANGGTFSVVGSVSGALASATVGVPYSSAIISFLLNDGSVDFHVGDHFVITIA